MNYNKSLKIISFDKLINFYCSNVIVYDVIKDNTMPELFLDVFICKLYYLTQITKINLQYLIDPDDLLFYLNHYIGINKDNKKISEIIYQDYKEIENFYLFYLNDLITKHITFNYSSISTNNIEILYTMFKKNIYINNALEIVDTYSKNKELLKLINYELNKNQLIYFSNQINLTFELLKKNYEIHDITHKLLSLYSNNDELKQFMDYKPNELYLHLINEFKNYELIIELLNNNYEWNEIFNVLQIYSEYYILTIFIKYKKNYQELKTILNLINYIIQNLSFWFLILVMPDKFIDFFVLHNAIFIIQIIICLLLIKIIYF
jgi:hypothetical protein